MALSATVIYSVRGLKKLGENSCCEAFNFLLSFCVTLEPKAKVVKLRIINHGTTYRGDVMNFPSICKFCKSR